MWCGRGVGVCGGPRGPLAHSVLLYLGNKSLLPSTLEAGWQISSISAHYFRLCVQTGMNAVVDFG